MNEHAVSAGEANLRQALRRSMEMNGDKLSNNPPEERPTVSNIDLQEFGRLQAEVDGMRRDSDRLLGLLDALTVKVDRIELRLSEAKGGWRVLMLIGGAAATLGSGLTWVIQHLTMKGS